MVNWLECSIRRSVSREKRPWLIMTSDFLLTRTRRNSEVSQWTSEFANFLYQEIQLYLDVRVRHSLWIKTLKMRFSFETQQWRVCLKGRLNKINLKKWRKLNLEFVMSERTAAKEICSRVNQPCPSWFLTCRKWKERPCWQSKSNLHRQASCAFISAHGSTPLGVM